MNEVADKLRMAGGLSLNEAVCPFEMRPILLEYFVWGPEITKPEGLE